MKARPAPISVSLVNPVHFLAVGGGAGLAPWMPGTFGTLVGIPLYLLLAQLPLAHYLLITAALFLVGIYLCGKTARDTGVHDHPAIVWDEIVGLLITMAAVPPHWATVLAGFLVFRTLDIAKPWPIGLLDRYVKGGFGIMIDDAVAALLGVVIMHLGLAWWGMA